MDFKIIRHTYENTGGGCMVSFDEVWMAEEDRTIFVQTNEMGCSFYTVDAYHGEVEIDPFSWIEIDGGKWLHHHYFELARECVRRYAIDDGGEIVMPYEWLPDDVQKQVTPDYRKWNQTELGGQYLTNGRQLIIEEAYDPTASDLISLDDKTYHRLAAALYGIKDAFHELNEVWDGAAGEVLDELGNSYPFEYSFDEMAIKVQEWVWSALHEADKRKLVE